MDFCGPLLNLFPSQWMSWKKAIWVVDFSATVLKGWIEPQGKQQPLKWPSEFRPPGGGWSGCLKGRGGCHGILRGYVAKWVKSLWSVWWIFSHLAYGMCSAGTIACLIVNRCFICWCLTMANQAKMLFIQKLAEFRREGNRWSIITTQKAMPSWCSQLEM